MSDTTKQKWERIGAKRHTRHILRSFLFWGIPMWAVQVLGLFLYYTLMQKPYLPPFRIWSPAVDFVFDFVIWVFGFGFLMGETIWKKREKDYKKDTMANESLPMK